MIDLRPAPPLLCSPIRLFLEHYTGPHPESPERLRYLHEFLKDGSRSVGQLHPAGKLQTWRNRHNWSSSTITAYIESVRRFAAGWRGPD